MMSETTLQTLLTVKINTFLKISVHFVGMPCGMTSQTVYTIFDKLIICRFKNVNKILLAGYITSFF